MMQWILTALIVLAALIYVAVKVWKYFSKPKKQADDCQSCSSDCESCPLYNDVLNPSEKKS